MRKRFLLSLVISGPLAILAALIVPQFQPLWPGNTPWNFYCLHQGMKEEEVAAILGEPGEPAGYVSFGYYKMWRGKGCWIKIKFNGDGAERGTLHFKDGSKVELREQAWSSDRYYLLCLGLIATALYFAFLLHIRFRPRDDPGAFTVQDVPPTPCPDHTS
jgi:hypothetical protein